MKAVKQLLTLMAPVRKIMFLAAVLSFLTVASNTLLLAIAAYLIAAAALHPPLAALATAITGVRLFGLSRAFFRYGERYFAHNATFQILAKMRSWFYAKIEPLAPGRLSTVKSGDLLSRIVSDVDTLQFFYLRVIAPPFVALFVLIFISWWLFSFGKPLVLILIAAFFLAGIAIPAFFRQKARNLAGERLWGRNFFKSLCVDALGGLTELASFDNSAWQIDKLNKAAISYENHNRWLTALAAKCESLKNLVLNAALAALLFAAVHLSSAGVFEKVWLAVVVIAAEGCFEAVGPLSLVRFSLDEALLSWKSLLAITAGKPAIQKENALVPVNFNLKVSNLSFSYDDSVQEVLSSLTAAKTPASSRRELIGDKLEVSATKVQMGLKTPPEPSLTLSNISFELKEGSHLAIVGASGAGKSTLVNILCRFFDYSKGSITFGGHELRNYAADDLRGYLAVVSQSTYLFNASVKDNILLAKPSASPEEFRAALANAGLEEFFSDKTMLDKPGALLSGGERQRVALARAFLKDAPLLILDEPTASLDTVTARKLMTAVYKLMQNRSSILITHDLSLLNNADQIILLDQGSIREHGILPSLLSQNGLFAQMYSLQNGLLKW